MNMTSVIHFGRRTWQHFFFFRLVLFVIFPLVNYIHLWLSYSPFSFLRACQQLFCPYWGMSILISQFFWFLSTTFRIRDMFVLVGSKMSCAVFDLVFVFTWYVNLCARFGRISHSNWTLPKKKGRFISCYCLFNNLVPSRVPHEKWLVLLLIWVYLLFIWESCQLHICNLALN